MRGELSWLHFAASLQAATKSYILNLSSRCSQTLRTISKHQVSDTVLWFSFVWIQYHVFPTVHEAAFLSKGSGCLVDYVTSVLNVEVLPHEISLQR